MKILLSIYCLAKLYIAATQCYSQLVIVYTVQLIDEVRSGAGTIQLLTLKPEELNKEITKKFEVLGIEIPDMKYVIYCIVQTWDNRYVSNQLDIIILEGKLVHPVKITLYLNA